jgi:hypothetical protein
MLRVRSVAAEWFASQAASCARALAIDTLGNPSGMTPTIV